MLMQQMRAYYPNQTLLPDTHDVYLREWADIAGRFGIDRFENALHNVLRRSEFIPLPQHIAEECRTLRANATTPAGSHLAVWICASCETKQAANEEKPCHACEGKTFLLQPADRFGDVELIRYKARIRSHPDEFISLPQLVKEAKENIARRRHGLA